MKSLKIDAIRKKFHREWLLIVVDKMDKLTTTPLTGRLIAHSPYRDDIYRLEIRRRGHTLTIYSDDEFPKGYAAAFTAIYETI